MSLEHQQIKESLHLIGRQYARSEHALTPAQIAAAPEIPSPSLFNFDYDYKYSDGTVGAQRLPGVSSCAAHLELLEVFYVLRQRILASTAIDEAMGIAPIRVTKTGTLGDTKVLKDETLWDRRQDKWTKFVEFAAVRFLAWRETLKESAAFMSAEDDTLFDLDFLPPLDVVMVWHSFMLNPLLLFKHCKGEPIMRVGMPWELVHDAIDNNTWDLKQGDDGARHFKSSTGLSADLFDQFSTWLSQSNAAGGLAVQALDTFKLDKQDAPGAPPTTSLHLPLMGSSVAVRYSDLFRSVNRSLAIELRDAVIRQASFVDKMNAHLWIRSPAVEGTIRRGINRYSKFLQLLKLYPKQTIVPTLDIDLVWHTHQCLPGQYRKAMRVLVGRFINHNDTIVKEDLGDGFAISKKYFRMHFGMTYRVCGCWDCEALLSALEKATEGNSGQIDMAAIAQATGRKVAMHRTLEVLHRKKDRIVVPHVHT